MMNRFPEIYDLIAEGKISLSALNRIVPYLHKAGGGYLLKESLHKSVREVERLVVTHFPKEAGEDRVKESVIPVSVDRVHISFSSDHAFAEKLKKAQAILRHKYPQGRLSEVLGEALHFSRSDSHISQ